jgi:hypothetical protein
MSQEPQSVLYATENRYNLPQNYLDDSQARTKATALSQLTV